MLQELSERDYSAQSTLSKRGAGGVTVVAGPSNGKTITTDKPSPVMRVRCLNLRMGSIMQGDTYRWPLVSREENLACKLPGSPMNRDITLVTEHLPRGSQYNSRRRVLSEERSTRSSTTFNRSGPHWKWTCLHPG